jgi:Histidine kinase-, DNA gyrase B-, and HSP90-like ATPase
MCRAELDPRAGHQSRLVISSARIKAVMRRAQSLPTARAAVQAEKIQFEDKVLDVGRREVVGRNGVAVSLSNAEFRLLCVFLERPGLVLSRDQLLERLRILDAIGWKLVAEHGLCEAGCPHANDAHSGLLHRACNHGSYFLNALLESICDDQADLGWNVEFQSAGRLPYPCRPTALRRAIRKCDRERRALRRRVRWWHWGPRAVEIVVEDEGPGIPEADREKVFDPFVRLETSRNRDTGGVGLGLSIARSIFRGHGGDITLSGNGSGLRVHLRLPAAYFSGRIPR